MVAHDAATHADEIGVSAEGHELATRRIRLVG
jgi:hypothetical protein